jgi:hypothetical protein
VLGETKVGHFDVSIGSEQQVLRLEVAVDDVERVEVVEGEGDLGGIEFGDRVGEALGLSERSQSRLTWLLRRRLNNSPPATKSMTMYRLLTSWNVPQRLTRNG